MSDDRSAEELLQSALSSAFTPVPIAAPAPPPGTDTSPPSALTSTQDQAPLSTSQQPLVSQEELAKYEEERAALERSWKEASARQRKETEERREKIAAERKSASASASSVGGMESWVNDNEDGEGEIRGPPNPLFSGKTVKSVGREEETGGYPGSPSPADVRDAVSGEPSKRADVSAQVSPRTTATLEQSQRWEEIDSLESSYPSLSFPEHSDSAPSSDNGPMHPESRIKSSSKPKHTKQEDPTHPTTHPKSHEQHEHHERPTIPSQTQSIFDPNLPLRTRALALLSSLSINLLLPFVNGVMLGFGEIFARNMAFRFFGWGVPLTAPPYPSSSTPTSTSTTPTMTMGDEGRRDERLDARRRPGGAATAVGVGAAGSSAPLRRD